MDEFLKDKKTDSLELDEKNVGLLFELGHLYRSMGRPRKSIEVVRRILKLKPGKAFEEYTKESGVMMLPGGMGGKPVGQ